MNPTPYSRGACPKCDRTYEAPIAGTVDVSHECIDGKARRFKRTERSKYDRMEG